MSMANKSKEAVRSIASVAYSTRCISTILQNGFFQSVGVNTIKSANMHYHIYKYCSFNEIV